MIQLIRALNFFVSIYMMIIVFRIILTWFSWIGGGKVQEILSRITDPYLNWFRRFTFLKLGYLDLSPIAALGVLSLVSRLLSTLALHGRISIGIILALALQALWGVVSFIIGFLIIVLILRLIAHLMRKNNYSTFWGIVDSISQPVIYRINRFIFKDRILQFTTAVIISIVSLGIIYLILRVLVLLLSGILVRFPL